MITDIGAAALLIAIAVQTTKFLLGYIVPASSPNQNAFTRLYVFAVAIALVLSTNWAYNGLHSHADVVNAIKFALSAGAVAIASYHLLTSDIIPLSQAPIVTPTATTPIAVPVVTEPPVT